MSRANLPTFLGVRVRRLSDFPDRVLLFTVRGSFYQLGMKTPALVPEVDFKAVAARLGLICIEDPDGEAPPLYVPPSLSPDAIRKVVEVTNAFTYEHLEGLIVRDSVSAQTVLRHSRMPEPGERGVE